MKNISVIIPTGGTNDDDLRLNWVLEALATQEVPADFAFETIVINDGGHSQTQALVESYADRLDIQYLYHGPQTEEFRLAATRNLGAEHANTPYLMYLDSDCVPQPLTVYRHFERLHYIGENCIVQGVRRMLPLHEVHELETPINYAQLIELSGPFLHRDESDLANLIGFNVSLSKADFEKLNGFDSSFIGWGGEDMDFGYRALKAGFHVSVIGSDADVIHLGHVSREPQPYTEPAPELEPEPVPAPSVDFEIVPAE